MKSIAAAVFAGSLLVMIGQPNGSVGRDGADDVRSEPASAVHATAPTVSVADLTDVVDEYCQRCHNERRMTGNLSLDGYDVAEAPERADVTERMIRKLRAGMMPPPGANRPAGDTLVALVETLEEVIDAAASSRPEPGDRPSQRLNRAEYERVVDDLFGLKIDADEWLPNDQISASFDNVADVQGISATLMDAYLNSASEIARQVVGQEDAPPSAKTYFTEAHFSQHEWETVEGAPYGTRGGISALHSFPADGKYMVSLQFISGWGERFHDIDISVDGEQVALLRYGGDNQTDFQGRRRFPMQTDPVFIRAGQHRITAAFVRKMDGPYEDLIRPNDWSLSGTEASYGTTSLPHITQMTVEGPYEPTGVSETATRERVFTCRPTTAREERPCAERIVSRLGSQAYRRPLEERDLDGLMYFYDMGTEDGGFEKGIRMAIEAMLASPHFLFRIEDAPRDVVPGDVYAISDVDLASRLSFFLWGRGPDEQLISLASSGQLSDPGVLERETLRMLEDPRSEALSTRFASLWLRLQDLDKVEPDAFWFPNYSQQLMRDMRRETELFFDHLVREDRSLLELLTADYTFVTERLANHYGIPDVVGEQFRRVEYPEGHRRGIFGHGSVLVQTSLGNRTSPVLRGKWVMEVVLGSPPPPPPPNVPTLDESTSAAQNGKTLTTGERMKAHRANPTCNSCHSVIDPIGLALENFDVTGRWRLREGNMPVDTRGEFYDGSPISSAASLSDVLLTRPIPIVRHFTQNLLTYALGRRVEYQDQPTVRAIAGQAEANDYRLSSFVLGVVQSDAFRMKRATATDAN